MSETSPVRRCGFVALVGAPNAGKSTLLNSLVGAKVSIVTPKPQTTRMRVRGVAMRGEAQIVFVDTPGIFAPKRRLDQAMVAAAWAGAGEADLIALIVDATQRDPDMFDEIAKALGKLAPRKILILNKVDAVKPESLLTLSAKLNQKLGFERTFMVSALRGDGVEDFLSYCAESVPSGPWHFPEDQLTDLSLALTAAELTREKLFLKTHQEIPYSATVEPEKFETREDGSYVIHQVIVVAREAHKKIVVGKGGQAIRAIGEAARKELEGIFDVKVHLFLFVKVRENWADDPARFADMGLEFPR